MENQSNGKKLLIQGCQTALFMEVLNKAQESIDRDKTGTIRGHVVGADHCPCSRDNINRVLPRNKPCACGSNIKAKKCCKTLNVALDKLQGEDDEV